MQNICNFCAHLRGNDEIKDIKLILLVDIEVKMNVMKTE